MNPPARHRTRILQAHEKVKLSAPASGPGWSVSFRDAEDRIVAAFSLASYAQLEMLADEVAPIGYALTVLDEGVNDCDFVFRETAKAPPDVLSEPATVRVPRPDMPAGTRGAVTRGDLVMQDSGGPVMLVNAMGSDLAYCVWFSEEGAVHSGTFVVSRLVNVGTAKRWPQGVATAERERTT